MLKAEAPRQNDFESVTTSGCDRHHRSPHGKPYNRRRRLPRRLLFYFSPSLRVSVRSRPGWSLLGVDPPQPSRRPRRSKKGVQTEPHAAAEGPHRSGFRKAPRHDSKRWYRSVELPAARRFEPIGCRVQRCATTAGRLLVFYPPRPSHSESQSLAKRLASVLTTARCLCTVLLANTPVRALGRAVAARR